MAAEFLEKLYSFGAPEGAEDRAGQKRVMEAIDHNIEQMDSWLWASAWDEIDAVLRDLDLSRLPTSLGYSVLMMTKCEKGRFPHRPAVCQRLWEITKDKLGEEKANRYMRHLW